MSRCPHPSSEARVWTLSNNAKQIVVQCLVCGDRISKALARASFTPEQLAEMKPLDLELIEKTRAAENALRESEKLAREAQRVERTEKYRQYLWSPEWKARRELVLRRANYICEGCLTARATQVHHCNYNHVFDELLFDLVAICDDCHAKAHRIQP